MMFFLYSGIVFAMISYYYIGICSYVVAVAFIVHIAYGIYGGLCGYAYV